MLQKLYAALGTFSFQTAPIQVNLIRGVNIHEVLIKISANVTVTDPGAGVAGTALAEGVQRLISRLRVRHDGVDRTIIDGRWAYRLFMRSGLDSPKASNLADGTAQVATAIEAYVSIPFERPWNAKPFDTVWSGRTPVAQELALYIEPETGKTTAASDAGTAALVSGGTMDVTFSTSPTFEVTQVYSTHAVSPLYVPHYIVRATDPFSAARTDLEFSLLGLPRFDAVLMRNLYGTNVLPQDGTNYFTFQIAGGATKYYNRTPFPVLQLMERRGFPLTQIVSESRTGELLAQFTDKGRLSSIVVPSAMNDPRFVFDVDTPTSGEGRIHMLFSELHKIPGVTRDNL